MHEHIADHLSLLQVKVVMENSYCKYKEKKTISVFWHLKLKQYPVL